MTNLYYTWQEFEKDSNYLVKEIKATGLQFDGIYALPRGGLILGVYLSHHLELPLLLSPTRNSLIVDDISNNGDSLLHFINKGKLIATLFSTEWTKVVPNLYVHLKEHKEDWIVYPWEAKK